MKIFIFETTYTHLDVRVFELLRVTTFVRRVSYCIDWTCTGVLEYTTRVQNELTWRLVEITSRKWSRFYSCLWNDCSQKSMNASLFECSNIDSALFCHISRPSGINKKERSCAVTLCSCVVHFCHLHCRLWWFYFLHNWYTRSSLEKSAYVGGHPTKYCAMETTVYLIFVSNFCV